jgi:hypothetical protein
MLNYQIAEDAKPQVKVLAAAIAVSIGLSLISWFLPVTAYLVYPLQLFATFVHEGGHVLAALLTGSHLESLTVSPDTSGVVWSAPSGWLAALIISSAGYLGTTAFGTMMLIWMRYGFSPRLGLYFSAAFIGVMTFVFGLLFPLSSFFTANVTIGSVAFTVLSGTVLTVALGAIAKYADIKWATFAFAFLTVQCLLNAFFSLKDLFLISTLTDGHSDAVNMASSTGIPAFVWVMIWLGVSVVMLSIGIRIYAVAQRAK